MLKEIAWEEHAKWGATEGGFGVEVWDSEEIELLQLLIDPFETVVCH